MARPHDGFTVIGFRDNQDNETNLWAMKLDAFGQKVWERYLGEFDSSNKITITKSKACDALIILESDEKGASNKIMKCLKQ